MCLACIKSQLDISEGITKEALINYCRNCERYLKPPLIRCDLESSEMMAMCLQKIKGLNKVKLVDSSFIWTEPHSKVIKLKLTIQKEIDKALIESSFIVEFRIEWFMCDDCIKSFTPHTWTAAVQLRQKVNHKKTFMLLEQIILKNRLHKKILEIKETKEGVDFYFSTKTQAQALCDFLHTLLPIKVKQSKQLISADQHNNTYNYKYTFLVEIAPITKDDLVLLDKETSKGLGGVSPILLCIKLATKIHFLDPFTFNHYEFDEHTYWKYNFKPFFDKNCLEEFLIVNVEEEIDYKLLSVNKSLVSLESGKQSLYSKSTYHKNALNLNSEKENSKNFKIVTVQCIFNNRSDDTEMITVKSHLGNKIKAGDIFLGYNLKNINSNEELDNISDSTKIPDIILIKKKYTKKSKTKRKWKLNHLNKEKELSKSNKQNEKNENDYEKQYEEFLEDIERDKELRKHVDLYKKEIKEEDLIDNNDNEDISDTDINVNELLENIDNNIEEDNYEIEDQQIN